MSTETNLRASNLWILIVSVLVLVQCTSNSNSQTHFSVTPRFNSRGDKVVLDFEFQSEQTQTFLLNWDALSVYDPNFERDGLLQNGTDLNNLLDSLKYPQFVVENKKNEKRFFSDIKLFEGEEMPMKSVFTFEDKVDTISVSRERETRISSDTIVVNRLKINESDNEVRLHYLFRPTVDQEKLGFKSVFITSNWIKLNQ